MLTWLHSIATALCRTLLKTYSRRDVLAMKLLLVDPKSRVVDTGKLPHFVANTF